LADKETKPSCPLTRLFARGGGGAARALTKDETRRTAVNFAKPSALLRL
jgi:hypothetical protein